MKSLKFAFTALIVSFVLFGCKPDTPGVSTLPSSEPVLSSGRYSPEYSKEEALEIFKSGDEETIRKVTESKKSMEWDGKSKFKPGVKYRIRPDQVEKARAIDSTFRKFDDMDREFQNSKKVKKKSDYFPGLAAGGIGVDAYASCYQDWAMARAMAFVEPQLCYCGVNAMSRVGTDREYDSDAGEGRLLLASTVVIGWQGGEAFSVAMAWGCGGGEMRAASCMPGLF